MAKLDNITREVAETKQAVLRAVERHKTDIQRISDMVKQVEAAGNDADQQAALDALATELDTAQKQLDAEEAAVTPPQTPTEPTVVQ